MTFSADLQRFTQKAGGRLDTVLRRSVLEMTRDIVRKTPVDTGHARSNWFWGVYQVTSTDSAMSKNGAPSIARSNDFARSLRAGGVVYLTNNLPYIMALEFGSSQQAPAGMVRTTVSRWQSIVDRAARAL